MEVSSTLEKAGQSFGSRQVFSEPIERGGTTVILAARVAAGAGAGEGENPEMSEGAKAKGKGSGLGYGFGAKALGAFILRDGKVRWQPAVDVNKIIMGGQMVAVAALIFLRKAIEARLTRTRRRSWLSGRGGLLQRLA